MKKRVICMLMALSMIFMLLPIGALAEEIHVATCSIEDTVLSNNHRVIPMFGGGSECRFNYDVPEGGKTMLIFYSSTCGNSKYFLNGLSSSPLINDSNLNIVAVESNSTDEDTARNTVEELLGDEKDNIDFTTVMIMCSGTMQVLSWIETMVICPCLGRLYSLLKM